MRKPTISELRHFAVPFSNYDLSFLYKFSIIKRGRLEIRRKFN